MSLSYFEIKPITTHNKMKYGICSLSVVAVYSSSSWTSEMCTQLLFGELIEVLERKGKQWLKIRCQSDNYIGWVKTNQITPITPSEFELFKHRFAYCLDITNPIMANDHFIPITIGARLPNFNGMQFRIADETYQFSGQAVYPSDIKPTIDVIHKIARRYLYVPFLHGGRSPFGIDSAGLVQLVFQMIGVQLPRATNQQVMFGDGIDFVDQTQVGDLAFFENRTGKVTHVGIVLEDKSIIHAHGKVQIDQLDHYGIFDRTQQKYTHKLRVIRRILPTSAHRVTNKKPIQSEMNPLQSTVGKGTLFD